MTQEMAQEMTQDRQALNQPKHLISRSIYRHYHKYAKGLAWLILCSAFGLNTACTHIETGKNQPLANPTVDNKTIQPPSSQHITSNPASTAEPIPESTPATTSTLTEEQLIAAIEKVYSEENPDIEQIKLLFDQLELLYHNQLSSSFDDYDYDEEETFVYTTMQNNALSDEATGRDLWYYSLVIREPRVRKLIDLQLTQSQADTLADELQSKALAKGDLSALTKTGYDNIVQAIGEPVFSTEKIDGSYRAYYDVSVQDPKALATGLNQLATALKSRCLVDYHPSIEYPFYYHHVFRESGEITFNRNRPIGYRLNEFTRRAVAEYPDIEDYLDMIYIRNYVYCYKREYVNNKLSGYLTGQTDSIAYKTYSIPEAKDQDPMRQRVVLSIIAELLDKKEVVPLFAYPLNDSDKQDFYKQRAQLLNTYRNFYKDTVPTDMNIEDVL